VITLGIDPGTKSTGLAWLNDQKVVQVKVARAEGQLAENRREGMADAIRACLVDCLIPDRVVIEWQSVRPCDRRPNDILALVAVAGMALAACKSRFSWKPPTYYLPLPNEWKGSVPKEIHQRRIMAEVGAFTFPESLKAQEIRDVTDAIGLALWGARRKG